MISYAWRSDPRTVHLSRLGSAGGASGSAPVIAAGHGIASDRDGLLTAGLEDAVTRTIEALGQDAFGQRFLALLNNFVRVDTVAIFELAKGRARRRLHHRPFGASPEDDEALRSIAEAAAGGCAAGRRQALVHDLAAGRIVLVAGHHLMGVLRLIEASRLQPATALLMAIAAKHLALMEKSETQSRAPSQNLISTLLSGHAPELSAREVEVCAELLLGLTTKDVARRSDLGVSTIVTYKKRAFQKLGIATRRELVLLYQRLAPTEPLQGNR